MSASSDSSGDEASTPAAPKLSAPLSPKTRDYKPVVSSPLAQASPLMSLPASATTKAADASSPQRQGRKPVLAVATPESEDSNTFEAAPVCNTLAPSDQAPDSPLVIHQRKASIVSQSPNPFDDGGGDEEFDSDEERRIADLSGDVASVERGFDPNEVYDDNDEDDEYGEDDDDDEGGDDDGEEDGDDDGSWVTTDGSEGSFGTPSNQRVGSNEAMSSSAYRGGKSGRTLKGGKGLKSESATSPAQVEESEMSVRVSSVESSHSAVLQQRIEDLTAQLEESLKAKRVAESAVQDLQSDINGLRTQMDSQKTTLKGEIGRLREKHSSELAEKQQKHEAETKGLRQDTEEQLARCEEDHKERLAAETATHVKERDALKAEVKKCNECVNDKLKELEMANARISSLESEISKEKASSARKLKLMEPVLSNLDTNMQTRIESLVIKDKRQNELILSLQNELMNAKEKEVESDAYLKHFRTQMAEQKERILHLEERCELMTRRYTSLAMGSASNQQ